MSPCTLSHAPKCAGLTPSISRTERRVYMARRRCRPVVAARIAGGPLAPNIRGWAYFTSAPGGTWVTVRISGLPPYTPAANGQPSIGPHGFHVHENGNCTVGDPANPFLAAGEHWNPTNQPHGNHAGDLPVLYSNAGVARMSIFTNRFRPSKLSAVVSLYIEIPTIIAVSQRGPLACA